ncbi:MAG TPA: hypothetical protein VGG19_09415 [Tepidisphaeraceae bacterium]
MKHHATRRFWQHYHLLSDDTRKLADAQYQLLKADARHPSLQLKKVGRFWSVRVGLHYRALAVEESGNLIWFWIGHHAEYDRLVK